MMRRAGGVLNEEELSVSQEMHFRQKLQVLVRHWSRKTLQQGSRR